MSFASNEYIFYFLPITVIVFYILNIFKISLINKIWLIGVSIYFLFSFKSGIIFFAFSALFNFAVGRILFKYKSKILLFVGILGNIGVLFFIKYTDFIINLSNRFLATEISFLKLALPIGLSFYSFRFVSYIIDSYRGKAKEYSFVDFLLYSIYFPIFIMGPIARHNEIIPKFSDFNKFNSDNFKKGLFIFSLGLAKKVLIANPLLEITKSALVLESPNSIALLLGMFTNLFAFYFDFSGYSDMSIGTSLFFNIDLKDNFNSPYKARNIQDYWKRWHISLTKFLNEYVFSVIYKPGNSIVRFCAATMITFFISGLWHGSGINYILWGLLHGFSMCVIAVCALRSTKKYILPKFLSRFITIIILLFAAALYSIDGLRNYILFLKYLFNFNNYLDIRHYLASNIYYLFILAVGIIISFYAKNSRQLSKEIDKKIYLIWLAGILLILSIFSLGEMSTFLYQNF